MMRAKGIAAVLGVTLLLGGLVATAWAAKADSTVKITKATGDQTGVDIKGEVKSPRAKCERRRLVTVWHDVDPPGPSSKDFKLGETRTNRKGHWDLSSKFTPDKVYAKVKEKRRCKGDRSPTVPVDYSAP